MALPPCTEDPHKWDLSFGGFTDWDAARNDCLLRCPMFDQCHADLAKLSPRDRPKGVVWAGKAYGERGQILDTDGMKGRSDRRRKAAAVTSEDEEPRPLQDHGTGVGRSAA